MIGVTRTTLALIFVLVAVLLAAGCVGSDVTREQHIILIKQDSNGIVTWIKEIDSGIIPRYIDGANDDEALDVIQTEDEGFVIAGGRTKALCNAKLNNPSIPKLTRLSKNGDILWEKDYPYETRDGIITVFQTPDTGFIAISQSGRIMRINSDGTLLWNHSVNLGSVQDAIKTQDGGFTILGHAYKDIIWNSNDSWHLAKFDQNGDESWIQSYNGTDFIGVNSITELKSHRGYLLGSYDKIFKTDQTGSIQSVSIIDNSGLLYSIYSDSTGFYAIINSGKGSGVSSQLIKYNISDEGAITGKHALFSLDYPLSPTMDNMKVIPTHDNEFFIADKSGNFSNNWINSKKLSSNGTAIWIKNHLVDFPAPGITTGHVKKIIETIDGGYLILAGKDKISSC